MVSPTDADVDRCIRHLKEHGRLICSKTVKETVRGYLRGEIDIPDEQAKQTDVKGKDKTERNKGRNINPVLSPKEAVEVSDVTNEFENQLRADLSRDENALGNAEAGDDEQGDGTR